jgi:hypothetical protein
MSQLKERHPKLSTYQLSRKLRDIWYSYSEERQRRAIKKYVTKERTMKPRRAQEEQEMVENAEDFKRKLQAVSLLSAEVSMPEPGEKVIVGMVWDDSGYTPGAALVADWTGHPDELLQAADQLLIEHELEYHRKHGDGYIEELEAEWGDRWMEVMTEGWDGASWVMWAEDFVDAMQTDRFGEKLIHEELDNWGDLYGYQWGEKSNR